MRKICSQNIPILDIPILDISFLPYNLPRVFFTQRDKDEVICALLAHSGRHNQRTIPYIRYTLYGYVNTVDLIRFGESLRKVFNKTDVLMVAY